MGTVFPQQARCVHECGHPSGQLIALSLGATSFPTAFRQPNSARTPFRDANVGDRPSRTEPPSRRRESS
jgi:hypothetical protein